MIMMDTRLDLESALDRSNTYKLYLSVTDLNSQ